MWDPAAPGSSEAYRSYAFRRDVAVTAEALQSAGLSLAQAYIYADALVSESMFLPLTNLASKRDILLVLSLRLVTCWVVNAVCFFHKKEYNESTKEKGGCAMNISKFTKYSLLRFVAAFLMVSTTVGCAWLPSVKEEQLVGGKTYVSRWKPERAGAEVALLAEDAIGVIDRYLQGELNEAEAKIALDLLQERTVAMDITKDNPKYNEADEAIGKNITGLYKTAHQMPDNTLSQRRDLLAFQIGMPVSGKTYSPKPDDINKYYDDDRGMCRRFFGEYTDLGSEMALVCGLDQVSALLARFDHINGMDIEKCWNAFEKAYQAFLQEEVNQDGGQNSIDVTFTYYEQEVFTISYWNWLENPLTVRTKNGDIVYKTTDLQELKAEVMAMAEVFDP